jgi:hypothetical protein
MLWSYSDLYVGDRGPELVSSPPSYEAFIAVVEVT